MQPSKSILDPTFQYTPANETDIRKTFAKEIACYECPYCGTVYAHSQSNCDGTDLVCCGERGHCTPYNGEVK